MADWGCSAIGLEFVFCLIYAVTQECATAAQLLMANLPYT